jgi:hypothetical protein
MAISAEAALLDGFRVADYSSRIMGSSIFAVGHAHRLFTLQNAYIIMKHARRIC